MDYPFAAMCCSNLAKKSSIVMDLCPTMPPENVVASGLWICVAVGVLPGKQDALFRNPCICYWVWCAQVMAPLRKGCGRLLKPESQAFLLMPHKRLGSL